MCEMNKQVHQNQNYVNFEIYNTINQGSTEPCQLSTPNFRLELPTSLFSFTGIIVSLSHWPLITIFFPPASCFKNLSHAGFGTWEFLSALAFRLERHRFHLRIFLGAKVQTPQNVCFLLFVPIALLGWDFDPSILRISSWEFLKAT